MNYGIGGHCKQHIDAVGQVEDGDEFGWQRKQNIITTLQYISNTVEGSLLPYSLLLVGCNLLKISAYPAHFEILRRFTYRAFEFFT